MIIQFHVVFSTPHKGSNMSGGMSLQLPQSESQGMNSRGSYTPTTEEDLDMIQVEL